MYKRQAALALGLLGAMCACSDSTESETPAANQASPTNNQTANNSGPLVQNLGIVKQNLNNTCTLSKPKITHGQQICSPRLNSKSLPPNYDLDLFETSKQYRITMAVNPNLCLSSDLYQYNYQGKKIKGLRLYDTNNNKDKCLWKIILYYYTDKTMKDACVISNPYYTLQSVSLSNSKMPAILYIGNNNTLNFTDKPNPNGNENTNFIITIEAFTDSSNTLCALTYNLDSTNNIVLDNLTTTTESDGTTKREFTMPNDCNTSAATNGTVKRRMYRFVNIEQLNFALYKTTDYKNKADEDNKRNGVDFATILKARPRSDNHLVICPQNSAASIKQYNTIQNEKKLKNPDPNRYGSSLWNIEEVPDTESNSSP
ncbi:MAG: hypothetical protein AAF310_02020 [Myxococcota bacterium]